MAKPAKSRTKKPPSLIDIARELPKKRSRSSLNFVDKAEPECRAELLELRAAYRAGELPAHIDGRYLFTHVVEVKYPGLTTDVTFRHWLAKEDQ